MTEEKLYRASEAAKELGVEHSTLLAWIRRGKVPAITMPVQVQQLEYHITQTTLDDLRDNILPQAERRTAKSSILRGKRQSK